MRSQGNTWTEFYLTTGNDKDEPENVTINYCGKKETTFNMTQDFSSYLLLNHAKLKVKEFSKSLELDPTTSLTWEFYTTRKLKGNNYIISRRNDKVKYLDLAIEENFDYEKLELEANLSPNQRSKILIKFYQTSC